MNGLLVLLLLYLLVFGHVLPVLARLGLEESFKVTHVWLLNYIIAPLLIDLVNILAVDRFKIPFDVLLRRY